MAPTKRTSTALSASMLTSIPRVSPPMTKKTKITEECLLDLGADLVEAQVLRRPSARNRSPYVADAKLVDGREVIVHMPSMDMGGKAGPGQNILVRVLRDKKGNPVAADAKGQYDTPKCQFASQLCKVEDPESVVLTQRSTVWIGAHPKLGEDIAEKLITQLFPQATNIRKQVNIIPGTRLDFALDFENTEKTLLLEIKTVVDTDYDPSLKKDHTARSHLKSIFYGEKEKEYQRAAIFPWGQAKQTTPEGEKCVSARAIKHLRDLIKCQSKQSYDTAVLFVVVRDDVVSFRPNHEACPVFTRVLQEAQDAGVSLLAHRIRWG